MADVRIGVGDLLRKYRDDTQGGPGPPWVANTTVVAVGVTQTGEREVLGFNVGAAESYGFWVSFLRGLSGIQASFVRGPGGSLEGKYPKAVDGRLTGAPPQEPEVPALGVPKEVIAV